MSMDDMTMRIRETMMRDEADDYVDDFLYDYGD